MRGRGRKRVCKRGAREPWLILRMKWNHLETLESELNQTKWLFQKKKFEQLNDGLTIKNPMSYS